MRQSETCFNVDDYLRLPEGFPAELIRGRLVKSPSPVWGHQALVTMILARLLPLVGTARAVPSPIDLFVDRLTVLQPDVLVVREPLGRRVKRARDPQLVFEVLAPKTGKRDRGEKTSLYLDHGVDEVWLVDPRPETIEIRRPTGAETFRGDEVATSRSLEGFSVIPNELFADEPGPGWTRAEGPA